MGGVDLELIKRKCPSCNMMCFEGLYQRYFVDSNRVILINSRAIRCPKCKVLTCAATNKLEPVKYTFGKYILQEAKPEQIWDILHGPIKEGLNYLW
jgi:hypothetical protein